MCAKSIGESNISGKKIEIYGMAWIRARVIDKSNGQNRQIDVSPWGGFTRVNGDKERVWEIRPSNAVNFGRVGSYDYSCAPIEKSFDYTVEFKKYGYKNIHDFLAEPRNRIDVMFKPVSYTHLTLPTILLV